MDTFDEMSLLPERLRSLSLSDHEVVLPYPEVVEALTFLASNSVGFLGWEGWARYPNGHGHYNEYPGIDVEPDPGEDWESFVTRSTNRCVNGKSQEKSTNMKAGKCSRSFWTITRFAAA